MFKPLGAGVPGWEMSRLSSRRHAAVPPFTCLTTDTRMSWTKLCFKVFGNGKPTPLVIPDEEFRQFRTTGQGPMRQESTSSPNLPPKEP